MKQTYTIPPTFDPSRSLASRLLTGWFGDARRADSVRIVILVLAPVLVGLVCYFAGVLDWDGRLGGGVDERLLAGFIGFTLVLLTLGMIGRSPRTLVSVDGDWLEIGSVVRGKSRHPFTFSRDEIESVEPITGKQYHEHYARFRGVYTVGRAGRSASLLLITTSSRQIVLAMPRSLYLEIEPALGQLTPSKLIAA